MNLIQVQWACGPETAFRSTCSSAYLAAGATGLAGAATGAGAAAIG